MAGIRVALKPLVTMFRSVDVADFGLQKLKQYRVRLIDNGLSRDTEQRSRALRR